MTTADDVSGPHMTCLGCGRIETGPQGNPTDIAPSSHCGNCPPWRCEDCGQMDSAQEHCGCWISLEGLPLADIKGLLAQCDLSVEKPSDG